MSSYPIDFVIIWVDGNDPQWQKERNKYRPDANTDSRACRYRDWDNLQYWFRGVEKFAPWVNNIFFVTWGHLPEWLNINHPKLKIIKHEDYIPKEYLPTFSSHTIELNLHRIKGLSEHFVYFNDDTFVIKKTKQKNFFKNGMPCDMAILHAHSHNENESFTFCAERSAGLLNQYFNKKKVLLNNFFKWFNLKYGRALISTFLNLPYKRFTGIWQQHLANSLCKSTIVELWEKEGKKLHETSSNKFRNYADFNQYIFKNWQLATGNFVPRSFKTGKSFVIRNNAELSRTTNYIKKQKGKMICINDEELSHDNFIKYKNAVIESFEKILPEKSGFEI
ncbi:MAG: Stealth CR1 domain-containing protein [Oscillospiraceae bacterium]|jgi:hypothetical protein|nr:Stealth CR1 domain-containing protein [Oscillospiraceae bacterium]